MEQNVIYTSHYIEITRRSDGYYIQSFRAGMSMEQFNSIMSEHPEIKITNFIAIKNTVLFAPRSPVKFGEARQRVNIEVSSDELKAYLTLCVMNSEISSENKPDIIKEILRKLNEVGVVFGIKHEVLLNELSNDKRILIAEGIPPENGKDSKTKMYELKEPRPEVKESGSVDHYELNLINTVCEGDWLGERIDPTKGTPGKSVKGNVIQPMPGKNYPLIYDRASVREVYENGITTLAATRNGAVHYEGDKIGVSNHLEITNNVDFRTGNVDFDGYLTVKGSIEDNFTVTATKDIEVLGDYGVGSAKEILSREGSIFIKGGISGKSRAVVKSKRDIYIKYISDASIICEGSVHIGFYCLNSSIVAKEVILDSPKGQIIGGSIQAEIKVVSSIIGSASEKRTHISVKGFDRKVLKERLEKTIAKIEGLKSDLIKSKQEISIYSNTSELTREQASFYEAVKRNFFDIRNNLKLFEDERKALVNYLRTHGEGEVAILKKAYPSTVLEIKKIVREIDRIIMGTSFFIQDGEIKEL